ncbi:efflux RND transporter periplasmic adaptor subunit [Stenotrophomonas sp. ISL-67]|uniref:efflux RND transporter periplasmic adaptor subunit n=1 Tax=Stenotrophomonas sp. ISL-67 TaxID=2819171 RepID=UPI001BEA121B|nr:efflux RND transporter periplasmic adaptor subunit [Stenotrophomonas sp. ISL-67]MBT2767369.1 efflux RND transporter periplasmic adaptor subunit [Stenotrophomonas sp. ISL-67]
MQSPGWMARACLLMAVALATGCGRGGGDDAQRPPTLVAVEVVKAQTVPNLVELPGRVEASRSADVRARADGIVERQLYVDGTEVEANAPLFQIDPRDLQARLQQARASLASARAARAQTASLRARLSTLVQRKAVSVQEYESAQASFRQADAALMEAQAAVDRATLQLDHATVRAPIKGRTGRAQVSEGALVSAAAATLLTRIDQVDPAFVIFNPSNIAMNELERGIAEGRIDMGDDHKVQVTILLDGGQRLPAPGVVDFSETAIDPATGSRTLRARFANPDGRLLPGQFVRGILAVGSVRNGTSLPERAIQIGEDEATVMLVNDENIAERRAVTLAGQAGGRWVVQSGLTPGDRVIVDGWHKIQPGQPVSIQSEPIAKAKAKAP